MKFNYKKIASLLASAAMVASTVGFAAAASYPAPFVISGAADGAVVVGSNAASTDWAAAVDISTDLSGRVSETQTTASVSGGAAKSLADGSDLMYLNDDLAENVATITDSNLPNILADQTFTDDGGTEYDYEQTITVGTDTGNGLAFSDSGNDLDDPAVIIAMQDDTAKPVYTLTISFDKAVNLSAVDSEGEVITLFDKEYTIGTASDTDTLILLGGSSETTVNVGESVTAEVSGASHEISLNAISDATTPEASITLDGNTKTFAQGDTKKLSGIDVYAKTVFRSGDNAGYAIIQLGSDKLTLETGSAVMVGTDADDIEGTLVTFSPATGSYTEAVTKITFALAAPDNDEDHILEGSSFVDPIFGTTSLDFVDLVNGPELDVYDDASTTRKSLSITKEGDTELGVTIEIPGSDPKSIPFNYQERLADDSYNKIHVVEGRTLIDDDYFILNSGNYQYFMQLTKVSLSATSKSDVHFKNVITGDTYNDLVNNNEDLNQYVNSSTTFTIDSQTFNVTAVNATAVNITSADFALDATTPTMDVYPIIDLIDGKDHLVAFTEDVTINQNVTTVGGTSRVLDLPTGLLQFKLTSNTSWQYKIDAGSWTANGTAGTAVVGDTYTVGTVDYVVNVTMIPGDGLANGDTSLYVSKISLEATQTANADVKELDPAILFVEDEDKSATSADTKYAVMMPTDNASTVTYLEAQTPIFTGASDSDTFDDTDYTGYLNNFGTYVLKDSSDTNQVISTLTYSAQQMNAEIFISETGSTITPGSSGVGGQVTVVKDTEVSTVSAKNLLVVGGSCINTVAAKILDSTTPLCGADFTTATSAGAGQYIIKSVASPYDATQVALLVAGYEAADTVSAVAKAKDGVVTDVGTSQVYPIVSA